LKSYRFTCGCTFSEATIKEGWHYNRRVFCPIHGTRIEHIIYTCPICGDSFIRKKAVNALRRCPICQKPWPGIQQDRTKKFRHTLEETRSLLAIEELLETYPLHAIANMRDAEIEQELNGRRITRERVRQIEAEALRKLWFRFHWCTEQTYEPYQLLRRRTII